MFGYPPSTPASSSFILLFPSLEPPKNILGTKSLFTPFLNLNNFLRKVQLHAQELGEKLSVEYQIPVKMRIPMA